MDLQFFQLEERIVYDAAGTAVVADAVIDVCTSTDGQSAEDATQQQQDDHGGADGQSEASDQDAGPADGGDAPGTAGTQAGDSNQLPTAEQSTSQWDGVDSDSSQQDTGSSQSGQAAETESGAADGDDVVDEQGDDNAVQSADEANAADGAASEDEGEGAADGEEGELLAGDAAQDPEDQGNEVVFIDSTLKDADEIAGYVGDGKTVHMLDGQSDGLRQIADALQEEQNVSAIHIISHGDPGSITLGDFDLTSDNIDDRGDDLAEIGQSLGEDGDILIYGCNVAGDEAGESLIDQIALKTGADVAASDDLTGGQSQDADADLEYQTGQIEADNVLGPEFAANYDGVLDSPFEEVTSAEDLVYQIASGGGLTNISNITYGGLLTQASTFDSVNLGTDPGGNDLALGTGILITSGDGTPPTTNSQYGYSGSGTGEGDADVEEMAGVVNSRDAFYIEFTFGVPTGKNAIELDFMFGSDEYPDYVDNICDGAAIIVDGVNYAMFENGTPLKVVSEAEFNDNTDGDYDIEYGGISSVKHVVAKLNESIEIHTIKIVIADTYDTSYDSGLFLSVLESTYNSGSGGIVTSEPPTDISLSNSSVDENAASGTVVGSLGATDADSPANEITYSIVGGSDYFEIDGSNLAVKDGAALNYESATSHEVTIRATDAQNNTYDEAFTITVNDVPEAPTDITLSNSSVPENSEAGAVVGSLGATDPDSTAAEITYSIVGDSDYFEISGSNLVVKEGADLNHEAAGSHEVTIRATDAQNNTYDEAFTITVNDVPEPPTDITLSNASVDENAAGSTVVGGLGATDPDSTANEITYSIVGGSDYFEISGSNLVVKDGAALNYEAAGSHQVTIRATDAENNTYDEAFTVTVNDVPEAPTDITLSNSSVDENSEAGTVVGGLGATDPDSTAAEITYSIVGSSDYFEISGSNLVVKEGADLNHEAAGSHQVTIRATDAQGNIYDEAFTVTVNDVAEPPTDITLSNSSVDENAAGGTVVGGLGATDPDSGAAEITYSIVGGSDYFEINGSNLVVKEGAELNHEAAGSHQVTIRATDAQNNTYDEAFTITVNDVPEAPTDITLSNASVDENSAAGTVVGGLGATDPDSTAAEITYSIVGGSDYFEISDNNLVVKDSADLNYEAAGSHQVTIRATDAENNTYDEAFTVTVNDVPEAPTDITLSNSSVDENSEAGTVVGGLGATDPDSPANEITYSIVGSSDYFEISGSNLVVKEGADLNYESATSHEVTIRATDAQGNTYDEAFTITVNDVPEAPTDITLSNSSVDENSEAGTVVGGLGATDPDSTAAEITYSIVGSSDYFEISGSNLVVKEGADLNHEAAGSHQVTIRATDAENNIYDEAFTITVNDIAEPPIDITLSNSSVDENAAGGTVVGGLGATDPDSTAAEITYSIVGSSDYFEISGSNLVVKDGAGLNYEAAGSHQVTIRATDAQNNTYDEAFTITVNDVPEAPTDITLSNSSVPENSEAGTVVGSLGATDPDSNEFSFTIVGGGSEFEIQGNRLLVKDGAALDFETKSAVALVVRATDATGQSYDQTLTVRITDVEEIESPDPGSTGRGNDPGSGGSSGGGGSGSGGDGGTTPSSGAGPGEGAPGGNTPSPDGGGGENSGPSGVETGQGGEGLQAEPPSPSGNDDNIFTNEDNGLNVSPDVLFEVLVSRVGSYGQGEIGTQEVLVDQLTDDIASSLQEGADVPALQDNAELATRKVIGDAIETMPELNSETKSQLLDLNTHIMDLAFKPSDGTDSLAQAREAVGNLQQLATQDYGDQGRMGQLMTMWINVLERSIAELSNQGFDVAELQAQLDSVKASRNPAPN